MRMIALAALGLLFGMAQARAADANAGGRLVQRWCTGCHVVGDARHGQDAAPPLPPTMERHQDRQWLRSWLANPHPPMPDPNLTRQEIEDIVAYLGSLPQQ